jgi:hypothetical protein
MWMPVRSRTYDTYFALVPAEIVLQALLDGIDADDSVLVYELEDATEVIWTTRGRPAPDVEFTHHGQVSDVEGGVLLSIRSRPTIT